MQGAAGAGEREPLVVTFTVIDPNTFKLKADTPYADIKEVAKVGRIVYAFIPAPVGPAFLQLTAVLTSSLIFAGVYNDGIIFNIDMDSDSEISVYRLSMLFRQSFGAGNFSAGNYKIESVGKPTNDSDAATKGYVDNILTAGNKDSVVIKSSTPNSDKKFRITVDDAGAITATEVV